MTVFRDYVGVNMELIPPPGTSSIETDGHIAQVTTPPAYFGGPATIQPNTFIGESFVFRGLNVINSVSTHALGTVGYSLVGADTIPGELRELQYGNSLIEQFTGSGLRYAGTGDQMTVSGTITGYSVYQGGWE